MRPAGIHLVATLLVLTVLAAIVFLHWFPPGLRTMAGGVTLFGLLVAGLLVCGPLLTALLHRASKTRRALAADWVLIGVFQAGALLYGVNALAQARPLALVFETDRFRVVTYADIPVEALPDLAQWTQPWSLDGLITVGIRPPQSEQERLQRLDDMLVDISPSQRPVYWQALALSTKQIRQRARPLEALRTAYPAKQRMIECARQDIVLDKKARAEARSDECLWLPLVGRHSLDWVVLLAPDTLQVKAFLPLDGFI